LCREQIRCIVLLLWDTSERIRLIVLFECTSHAHSSRSTLRCVAGGFAVGLACRCVVFQLAHHPSACFFCSFVVNTKYLALARSQSALYVAALAISFFSSSCFLATYAAHLFFAAALSAAFCFSNVPFLERVVHALDNERESQLPIPESHDAAIRSLMYCWYADFIQNGRWPLPKCSRQQGGAGYFPGLNIIC